MNVKFLEIKKERMVKILIKISETKKTEKYIKIFNKVRDSAYKISCRLDNYYTGRFQKQIERLRK